MDLPLCSRVMISAFVVLVVLVIMGNIASLPSLLVASVGSLVVPSPLELRRRTC